ncbi:MAG: hypothetical protein KF830_05960 [Planctomycetes bacterium]|nr:hypothetical protein [Planctomycetota bacterium]
MARAAAAEPGHRSTCGGTGADDAKERRDRGVVSMPHVIHAFVDAALTVVAWPQAVRDAAAALGDASPTASTSAATAACHLRLEAQQPADGFRPEVSPTSAAVPLK